jgi:hypothetical protein
LVRDKRVILVSFSAYRDPAGGVMGVMRVLPLSVLSYRAVAHPYGLR